jgi:hypothetical protein
MFLFSVLNGAQLWNYFQEVWPVGLQQFLRHLSSLRPTIKFTMEVAANDTHIFLEVLVMKKGPKLATKVYRKPIHTGCYLHFKSNHPHTYNEESFTVWSAERRSDVRIRRISTRKLRTWDMTLYLMNTHKNSLII